MKLAIVTVRSSHGRIRFIEKTGAVYSLARLNMKTFGPATPLRFDVQEWRRHHGKDASFSDRESWDILDFGYWYVDDKGDIGYEPPAEDWRALIVELNKESRREERRGEENGHAT